jgi:iron-sulfur cluster assembly protein
MVTLSNIAAEKVQSFLAQQESEAEVGLRIGVRGGGCSGFQYALALDERRDDDNVFEHEGNPNLVDSCGCGSSFRIADEDPSCGSSAA